MLLVLGDSFSEKYFAYFSGHAKEAINFRLVYNFPPEPFLTFKPDLVVQETLNMYLLQPPHANPKEVQAARARALQAVTAGQ